MLKGANRPQKAQKHNGTPLYETSLLVLVLLAIGCSEEGHCGSPSRLWPRRSDRNPACLGSGRPILTLTVKEGDPRTARTDVLTLDTRDAQLAIDRVKAEQASAEAQLRLVEAGCEGGGHPPGQGAD